MIRKSLLKKKKKGNFSYLFAYFTLFFLLIINAPLILIPIMSAHSKYYAASSLTKHLQTSSNILIANICCLASSFPMAIELIFDIIDRQQNILPITTAQLFARGIILTMLLSMSGIFIFFRTYYFVSAFFVASYYTNETLMLASMYIAVDAEVSMKMELLMQFGLLVFCIVWTFANIFMAYSFFFNTYLLSYVSMFLQLCSLGFFIYFLRRWHFSTKERQRLASSSYDFYNNAMEAYMNTYEYSTLAYMGPMVFNSVMILGWKILFQEFYWQTHSENTLVYFMIIHYLATMGISVIPGQVFRMVDLNQLNATLSATEGSEHKN